ncbi:BTAD domain-containing putative transcriptional regulator [Micromonospora sp. NPDC047548]|uniref:AfsR/SARP family transcriptional regulator n=1 Tax=Micromonospora sp. NPDC047548 TaxID=3155624 RepID=UPI003410929E
MTSTSSPQPTLRFGLFGGVRVWRGDVELALGPPKQRATLGLLLAAGGQPVTIGQLLSVLWEDEPAATALNQIHRYIGVLRRIFEPDIERRAAGRWLLPTGSGYRLAVDEASCDLLQFRSLVAAAGSAQRTGSVDEATRLLVQALGIAAAPPADELFRDLPMVVAIEDERVRVAVTAAEHALLCDMASDVLPGLRGIAAEHALDETVQASVMRCLNAVGRPWEALTAYDRVRERLRQELGADPGRVLVDAQRAILAQQPAPDITTSPSSTRPAQLPSSGGRAAHDGGMSAEGSFAAALRVARHAAGLTLEELAEASGVSARALSNMERGRALGPQRRTVALIADALKLVGVHRDEFVALAKAGRTRPTYPAAAPGLCELPGSIGDFTGRAAELAWIFRLVDAVDEPADSSHAAVISGGAGLGKTTLVVRAAHRLRDRFPGGVHFLDALGMSARPVGSDEILARALRALGVRDHKIPEDAAERAGHYRQLLREKRVLVIVDDVASEAQVRPLIPGGGHSQLLVTSRRLLAGLVGVQRLHLDPMPVADASNLLSRILAERADVPDDRDLQSLVDLLGGLPLAVRIVGNRLVSRPIWSAADLTARLSVAERRLDQLSAGDLKVAAAFGISYEQLPDLTRQVFRRTALAPGPDFSASLAAVSGEVTVPDAEDHLDDLVDLGLVETAQGGRYRLHDLVRLYAKQRLEQDDEAATVAASRRRMAAWLLVTLTDAGRWFEPKSSGTAGSAFGSVEEADAWIRAEAEHWFPALGDAATAGDHHAVVNAVSPLHWFADRWVHWPRWTDLFMLAVDSAVALGDATRQAEFLTAVAWTYTYPGRDFRPALSYAERALAVARAAGDVLQEGRAWLVTARARKMLGDPHGALAAVRAASERSEQAGDADNFCLTLTGRGDIALALGEVDEALASLQRAVEMADDPASGMTPSVAAGTLPFVLGHAARAFGRAGRAAEGIPLALRAVDLSAEMQNIVAQAAILLILAEDLYGDDQVAEAQECLLRAAEIYESAGLLDDASSCRGKAAAKGNGVGMS